MSNLIHNSPNSKTNIVVLITHSLSEMDVLLPIFSEITLAHNVHIELIFAVRTIYRQYQQSAFYRHCCRKLDVKVSYHLLPNKFDTGFRFFLFNRFGRFPIKGFFLLLRLIQYARCFTTLHAASILLHEFSNQTLSTSILYRIQKKYATPIWVYDHGHAIRLDQNTGKMIEDSDRVTLLNFHEHNHTTFSNLGFKKQTIIGYSKFYPQWEKVVRSYKQTDRIENDHQKPVVIFSRHVHPYYMDQDVYCFLLTSAVRSIRNSLGSRQIIIKPHPREDIDLINELIQQQDFTGIEISNEHPAVLSQQALFAISFWGSTILDPLSFDIPAIEYYIEAEHFRELEPEGSSYRNLGIDSVDNEHDLKLFIQRVVDGTYRLPAVVSELRQELHIDTLFELVDPNQKM